MPSFRQWSSAFALCFCIAPGARAATEAELAEIRAQIRELRSQYESRIQALEARLKEAEDRAAAPSPAAASLAAASGIEPAGPNASASAFNPAISAILAGRYANLSRDPATYGRAGFARGGDIGPGRRGFSLGESELVLSANVDPSFAGNLTLSVSPEDTIAVEEAYGQWLTAPYGITAKFGRFLSGIGYLNEQHAHAWDFVDAPLAYQAMLGGQYANDGVQARWIAPTEQFLELGAEVGSGTNFPGTDRSRNGVGSSAIHAHTGGDIGVDYSWRAGASYLATRAERRPFDGAANDPGIGFTGTSRVAIADFVWKYAPNGNTRETNAKIQGEYLLRRESGDISGRLPLGTASYSSRQSAWYVQGVYQWHPEWRAGVRFDRLDPGAANAAIFDSADFRPRRTSVMVDYNPSEFSRIRLQYARSETLPGATDNQWFVQYILSLGAHGAHKY